MTDKLNMTSHYLVKLMIHQAVSDLDGLDDDDLTKIIFQILDNELIKTPQDQLHQIAVECSGKNLWHHNWGLLAGRLELASINQLSGKTIRETTEKCSFFLDSSYIDFVNENADELDAIIVKERDQKYDWMSIQTLKQSYLLRGESDTQDKPIIETPQQLWLRVSIWMWMPNMSRIKEVYDDLSSGNYVHASPTLFNAGSKRSQCSSCFLLTLDDNLENIIKGLWNCAFISARGGGVGMDVSNIRHSEIAGGGYSKGIVGMLKVYDELIKYVSQADRRRGSATMFLAPHHVDIMEFIDMRNPTGADSMRARDLFYCLWVSNLFMERVENDGVWSLFCPNKAKGLNDVYGEKFNELYESYEKQGIASRTLPAREVWSAILAAQIQTGMPFICYKDTVNEGSNQKNLGVVRSSNLCVHGSTYILTKKGQIPISTLENKEVEVWNGEEWSKTIVRKTGKNKKLVQVKFSCGSEILCTPEHKFYVRGIYKEIEATAESLPLKAVLAGWKLPLYDNIQEKISPKHINDIPLTGTLGEKIGWFEEFSTICGRVLISGPYQSLSFVSPEREFLFKVKLLLNSIGISPTSLRFDKNHKVWFLTIINNELIELFKLNYTPELEFLPDPELYDFNHSISVEEVNDYEGLHDTFCLTEHKRHRVLFNGILTGQCLEIMEVSDSTRIASCNLASIGLDTCVREDKTYDFEKLSRLTKDLTRNLNQVIDRNYYLKEVPEIEKANSEARPLGIGVHAFADTLALMDLTWNSEETFQLNDHIFETMYAAFVEESAELAAVSGPYDGWIGCPSQKGIFQHNLREVNEAGCISDWDSIREKVLKYGMRNSLGIALMPTASSAQINGKTESFEPLTSNLYARTLLSGMFYVVNKHMVKDLELIELWNRDTVLQIMENQGSLSNLTSEKDSERLDFLKEKYKTVWEIPQKRLVDLVAQRGKWIDQSQSFNCHMANPTVTKLQSFHFYGWKHGLKTGMYYLRNKPAAAPINFALKSTKKEPLPPSGYVCTEDVCISCQS